MSKLDIKAGSKLAEKLEGEDGQPLEELEGLSETQQIVLRLRLRGVTIRGIAKGMGVTPALIHRHCVAIREIKAKQITERKLAEHAADAVSVYEEVEQAALAILSESQDPNIKIRAMSTVLAARDKHVRLLMDLGYMQKVAAKQEINHTLGVIKEWEPRVKEMIASNIIEAQLVPLEAPVPMLEDGPELPLPELAPVQALINKKEEYDFFESEEIEE